MSYQIFTEKEINKAILKKAPLENTKKGKSPHLKSKLILDGYYFGIIKVPNPHKKEFMQGKARILARQLQLTKDQYNLFIKCKLDKRSYEDLLKSKME